MKKEEIYKNYNTTSVAGVLNYDQHRDIHTKKSVFDAHISPNLVSGKICKAVDIGCGYGAYIKFLNEAGVHAQGVDLSVEQINLGTRLFGLNSIRVGDGLAFLKSLPDETIDLVLLMDILEHLSLDLTVDILNEANRVLRVGGKVIIMAPNFHAPFAPTFAGDITHVRAFSCASMRQLLLMTRFTSPQITAQKIIPQRFLGCLRMIGWHFIFNPFLNFIALAMHGTRCGGAFTPNLIGVASKS